MFGDKMKAIKKFLEIAIDNGRGMWYHLFKEILKYFGGVYGS